MYEIFIFKLNIYVTLFYYYYYYIFSTNTIFTKKIEQPFVIKYCKLTIKLLFLTLNL
jgi:hypothetical protein